MASCSKHVKIAITNPLEPWTEVQIQKLQLLLQRDQLICGLSVVVQFEINNPS